MFSEQQLDALRENIKQYMGAHRYDHTLGVEKAVIFLGSIFLPEHVSELRVAALLHDITKEMSYDDQFSLLSSEGLIISEEDKMALPALHSFSAVPFIKIRLCDK